MGKTYLHLDAIMNNPSNTIRLYLGSGQVTQGIGSLVKGYLASDIRFSGSNEFDAPFSNDLESVNELVLRGQQAGYQLGVGKNFILKSVQQTISTWKGSERFTLPIEMFLINYRRSDEVVLKNLKQLITTANPTSIGNAGLENLANGVVDTIKDFKFDNLKQLFGSFQTTAPRGYEVKYNGSNPYPLGGCYIAIGKWFVGRDLLIKDFNFAVSKESLDDGRPLMATVSFTLESFKMLTAEEINSFIIEKGDFSNSDDKINDLGNASKNIAGGVIANRGDF